MADNKKIEIKDQRKIKQDELGPAAVVRTTTLKPKEENPEPKSKTKTPAQIEVARAKLRDAGISESVLDEPKQKKPKPTAPAWGGAAKKKLDDRRVDNPEGPANAPAKETENPIELMDLVDFEDGKNWCHCGRALYTDGQTTIICRDGHHWDPLIEGFETRLTWEEAALKLRTENNAGTAAVLMAAKATEIKFFWEEVDQKEQDAQPEHPVFEAIAEQANLGASYAEALKDQDPREPTTEEHQQLKARTETPYILEVGVDGVLSPEEDAVVEARVEELVSSMLERRLRDALSVAILQTTRLLEYMRCDSNTSLEVLHDEFKQLDELRDALDRATPES